MVYKQLHSQHGRKAAENQHVTSLTTVISEILTWLRWTRYYYNTANSFNHRQVNVTNCRPKQFNST